MTFFFGVRVRIPLRIVCFAASSDLPLRLVRVSFSLLPPTPLRHFGPLFSLFRSLAHDAMALFLPTTTFQLPKMYPPTYGNGTGTYQLGFLIGVTIVMDLITLMTAIYWVSASTILRTYNAEK